MTKIQSTFSAFLGTACLILVMSWPAVAAPEHPGPIWPIRIGIRGWPTSTDFELYPNRMVRTSRSYIPPFEPERDTLTHARFSALDSLILLLDRTHACTFADANVADGTAFTVTRGADSLICCNCDMLSVEADTLVRGDGIVATCGASAWRDVMRIRSILMEAETLRCNPTPNPETGK